MGKIIDINKEEFQSIIDSEKNIILVDFWAPWCGPCKVLGPTLESVSNEIEDVTILKVNVDEENNSELSAEFGVRGIPTVFLFKDGKQLDKFVGTKKKEDIISLINNNREIEKDESTN